MLMPCKPETIKILEEIKKLEFLRDVVIPFVKEREREGDVDLRRYFHECGTPSCLYGWSTTFKEMGLPKDKSGFWSIAQQTLGFDFTDMNEVFGGLHVGTLDDRAQACTRIIERKMREIAE